ncbi:MAG: alpha/beta fold hydrolase [Woeseiaceae bacterium]
MLQSKRCRGPLLLSFFLLSWTGADSAPAQSAADEPPAPGTYIWVGDHRLHLDCRGSGSPTVVFDSGLGGSSLDWTLVQPEVASFTRACAYDRAGYAWSDPGPLPRDSEHIVSELEQLLGNGSVAAPYVLVGHSFGGLIVQRFARQHPQKIAGLVLVDATHEDQFRRLEEAVTPSGHAYRWSLRTVLDSYNAPEGLPEDVRLLAGAFAARAQSIVVVRSELNFLRNGTRAAAAGDLPDVPVIVISHRVMTPATSARKGRMAEMWMEMQLELAARARRSTHVIAATDDHYVHIREPETVIEAVRAVVEQHRREEDEGATGPVVHR